MGSGRVVERGSWKLVDGQWELIQFNEDDTPVPEWQLVVLWLICIALIGLWVGFLAAVLW